MGSFTLFILDRFRISRLSYPSNVLRCGAFNSLTAKEYRLPEVYINSNESFDASLKRFNKMVQQSGILAEARRREHFEPPSVTRKKKAAAKRRKTAKNAARG